MPSFLIRHSNHVSQQPLTRTPTICVVDPQANDYQNLESLAQASGARLEIVATAEQALRIARNTPVDLWVINTALPGLSGCELCGMLKSQRPAATIYMATDEYSPAAERAAFAARATMFGCKPQHHSWIETWLANRRSTVRSAHDRS